MMQGNGEDIVWLEWLDKVMKHLLGISAFVVAGHLILRSYDKELNRTIVSRRKINLCPMCGRKFGKE